MRDDRSRPDRDEQTGTESVNELPPTTAAPAARDPNDEIPVPIAMYPSEIDERAQVVEALREESNENRADDLGLTP